MRRRTLLGAGTAGLALWTSRSAWAAAPYPSQALRVIVPFTPGGTTDYVTRLVGAELSRSVGQPVVVDNRPGAGTVIGVDAAAKAAPDGYTFVTVANSFAVNRTLVKSLPYDSTKDLRPVALMGLSEHVLAAYPGLGIRTVDELVAYGRRNPGKLSFASFGNGTSAHLAGEMLKSQLGLDIVHIPYKGQGPALNDLLGGQVSIMFGNWPEFAPQVKAGKLVAIGMATAKRSQAAKDVPTLAEQGAPIESNSWNGLLAPAATPDAQVLRINAEVNKALATQAVLDAFAKGGIQALPGTPEQFAAFLASEYAKYAKVIRDADIKLES